MLFQDSQTGRNSAGTLATVIFKDWEVLWEYDNPDVFSDKCRFLAKKGDKYCIGNYLVDRMFFSRTQPVYPRSNDGLYGDLDFTPDGQQLTRRQKEPYVKNSLFFENLEELVAYAKDLKRVWEISGKRENDTRLQILLAIKREYIPFLEYKKKYLNRTRLDMVE